METCRHHLPCLLRPFRAHHKRVDINRDAFCVFPCSEGGRFPARYGTGSIGFSLFMCCSENYSGNYSRIKRTDGAKAWMKLNRTPGLYRAKHEALYSRRRDKSFVLRFQQIVKTARGRSSRRTADVSLLPLHHHSPIHSTYQVPVLKENSLAHLPQPSNAILDWKNLVSYPESAIVRRFLRLITELSACSVEPRERDRLH